ncbi:MAG: DUF4214 domain-containing protein [Pikeienuella sp.]
MSNYVVKIGTGRFAENGGLTVSTTSYGYDYNGTAFDDWLLGTNFNDEISGRDGFDTIEGFDGDDLLKGNDDGDVIYGDYGWDTLVGGDGRDFLDGGPGNDRVGGGQGTDTLYGFSGDDLIGGDGNPDFLYGEAGRDTLVGGNGDDSLWGGTGDDQIDGGNGVDVAFYERSFEGVEIRRLGPDSVAVALPDGSEDRLDFVEFAEFTDGVFEIRATTDDEGVVYRLYEAAYDRPSDDGLDWWVAQMAAGMSEETVAAEFLKSPEYTALYGENPSDADLIDALYENVLGREADAAGREFWLDALASGLSEEEMLLIFSESPEHIAAHAAQLDAGMFYLA